MTVAIITGFAVPIGECVVVLCLIACFCRRKATKKIVVVHGDQSGLIEMTNIEPLPYCLDALRAATNGFSDQNKLGEGGFGAVFKGTLPNGQLIAVKRLSQGSKQGAQEYKNEVNLLMKLQHRNVVRLLGSCLEDGEKLLIYEFVQNKSLDCIIFDPERSKQLNWSTRYEIARGIARGMLYLHEDSQPQIIHRDLKASNILLDSDMNPKISDFGMARIFKVDQSWANTNKIAGTFGYMPPEYAMNGQFSVKTDVYSFGVLLLELIIGKKNGSFYQAYGSRGIAIHAWRNWRGGTPLAVLDLAIGETYSEDEVLRCLGIGLLCVQEDPNHRPTMANVLLELSSRPVTLELPHNPAFFLNGTETPTEEPELDRSTGRPITTQYYSLVGDH